MKADIPREGDAQPVPRTQSGGELLAYGYGIATDPWSAALTELDMGEGYQLVALDLFASRYRCYGIEERMYP